MKIDCDYTDNPTCPYCGHEETHAWELHGRHIEDSFKYWCGDCDQEVFCQPTMSVYYSTQKAEGGDK